MRNLPFLNKEQKCWLALSGILVISSVISIGMFKARIAPSEHGPYTSLIWNLILSWIPYISAIFVWALFESTRLIKLPRLVLIGVCAAIWLLFFPNAFYILTDFQHIRLIDNETPVWYDVIMLLWFSWSGVFLGIMSLTLMQNVVTRWLGYVWGWIFAVLASVLSSLGVYIGRFIQVNSWDLIVSPSRLFGMLREHISYPPYRAQTVTYSLLFSLFFLFVYIVLFIFGQLIKGQEHQE